MTLPKNCVDRALSDLLPDTAQHCTRNRFTYIFDRETAVAEREPESQRQSRQQEDSFSHKARWAELSARLPCFLGYRFKIFPEVPFFIFKIGFESMYISAVLHKFRFISYA